ncbi:MAG TPA: site-specific DNA-methyltransferase [Solirubrobacteraceae bacterium]|nr:site-specific DNA-methyltransferase [Solirubrobacteraceae bacterium]
MRSLSPTDEDQPIVLDDDLVIEADAALVLPRLPDGAFELIYIDPPFNTGHPQRARRMTVEHDELAGDRTGFGGRRYRTRSLSDIAYPDSFADYSAFLRPKLERSRELLAPEGTLYVHLDYREAHYVKVALDEIFGRDCFLNEIIWAYDYGAKPARRWPAKHDTILVYVRDPRRHLFDAQAVEREPYMAPGLVSAEKAARGKRPTDTWWHTIVPTNGSERTGYPTQKPEGVLRRIVAASSRRGGWCLDFFAGSGTLGAVAAKLDRRYVLVDSNPEAIAVIRARLNE